MHVCANSGYPINNFQQVIGTPPTLIPSIIATCYQTCYGKQLDEVTQKSFVCQCCVIVQVIGETIVAIKLASAGK
jgi:hypothetical protein